ncbi:hypothetical protein TWF481_010191 [Arthrobotrys musiformis]|uniref:Uncharacterized protein n=1 Tax=Arthrobotrys musiformis TaxID=47236 RepID=A0AAV9W1E9_9PEZI
MIYFKDSNSTADPMTSFPLQGINLSGKGAGDAVQWWDASGIDMVGPAFQATPAKIVIGGAVIGHCAITQFELPLLGPAEPVFLAGECRNMMPRNELP